MKQPASTALASCALCVSLLSSAALQSGCGERPAATPRTSPRRRTEADILRDARHALAEEPALVGGSIRVRFKDDVLFLEGTVATDAERKTAGRIVTAVPGVPQVINLIEIATASAGASRPAGPARTDAEILADLKATLALRSELADSDVRYYVRGGTVTLTGWVPTTRHLQNLRRAARTVFGVKDVQTAKVYVDEALTAAIHKALDRFNEGMLLNRYVHVRLGEATLGGRGTIGGVREQAGRLVAGIAGVRRIENKISDDAAIDAAIQNALANDAALQQYAGRWRGAAIQGAVTLEGWISQTEGREALRQAVLRIPGVRSVDVSKVEIRAGD